MNSTKKETVKNSLGRALFVALSLLIQIGWILAQFIQLSQYYAYISFVTSLLALIVVFRIYGGHKNGAIKTSWIILILLFPVGGLCLYLLGGRTAATGAMRRRFGQAHEDLSQRLSQDTRALEALEQESLVSANQARYIQNYGGYPLYHNTDVVFYAEAEDGLAAQKEALKQAKQFIFMEYHAIEDSVSFHGLEEILVERAAHNVEVRLFYDDMGSIGFLSSQFIKRMESKGIQCRVFNPLLPFINVFMNNRDHRKVTVIDGQVGFTGGYNLADEYFNLTHPYGQWKDTGIKLTGDAVCSLTTIFLEMWNGVKRCDGDYAAYFPPISHQATDSGWVQPYADSPLDDERVGENVYLNLIKSASKRLYAMTPYLILDDEMVSELSLAAKRGVDVRIITPGIPDKKMVFKVTRSYYAGLAKHGVRIYEYTPGFIHAKQMLADHEAAAIGTINLDYRSLYHHFENACLIYRCPAVEDMGKDFERTFPLCQEVTDAYRGPRSMVLRGGQCLLRLFAPLM